MINWFDMPAEGLSNGGQFEVKELEVTENGTYEEKGEMYNKVTVNVEGGGALIVNTNGKFPNNSGEYDYNETLDATFAEIYDTLAEGKPVYIKRLIETDGYNEDYGCCSALYSVLCAYKYNTEYRVYALSNSNWTYGSKSFLGKPTIATFSASSPSDYPTAIVNATLPISATEDTWD